LEKQTKGRWRKGRGHPYGRPDWRVHLTVFLFLVLAMAGAGYRSYFSNKSAQEGRLHRGLKQIARLKANEVAAWRLERLGDATVAATDARMIPAMKKLLTGDAEPRTRQEVLDWMDAMRTSYQYENLVLLNAGGEIKLNSGRLLSTPEFYRQLGEEPEVAGGVVLRAVPEDKQSSMAYMTTGVELKNERGERMGSMLLGVDPEVHFYPVILKWSSNYRTGETVLVERNGDEIVYLSKFEQMPEPLMKLRTKLDRKEIPGVQAALGEEGPVDGTDEAGTKVFAAAEQVPNSSWYVIARINAEDAYEPVRAEGKRLAEIFGLLALSVGCGLGLLWWHQVSVFFRQKYQGEKERRVLSGHYDYLTRFANDAVLLLDEDGGMLEVNERATEMFGYAREEMLQMNVRELRDLETLGDFDRVWGEVQEKKSLIFETRNCRKDGSTFSSEVSVRKLEVGKQSYCQAIIRDVTERKKAESALRESSERFRAIYENAGIGIALVDCDGHPVKCNPAFEKMIGYKSEELKVKSFTEITHPEDRALDWGLYGELLANKREKYTIEKRYVRRNGEIMWGLLTVTLLSKVPGEPECAIGMVEDITERKELEEQFRQSQKLEGIGKLAGGVAHDFNNLLTVINGYCEVVQGRLKKEDQNYRNVGEIRRAGERATSLTQQLLAFSRRQVSQPRALHLNALVAESEKLFGRLVGDDIVVEMQLKAKPDRVMADSSQLHQVLMNLVVNARDAMPKGGKLTIQTSNAEIGVPREAEELPGNYVLLTVGDTGVGMDAETQKHVFEPFYTTKERGKGTGLGLSTVYGIVRQSGGMTRVVSEKGKGTEFHIYLPLTEEAVATAKPLPVKQPLNGKEMILVVEDQENVRGLALETLTSYGYSVLAAANGQEALEVSKKHKGRIDLLLTDVVMPGMDGKELAGKLRALRPEIKVVYASGYGEEVISHRGVLESGVEYLQKPFGPSALAAKVREVLGQEKPRTILVVDDEEGVRHLFRDLLGTRYQVLLAADGREAMKILAGDEQVDLVITDLVMPNQEGIETIRALRARHAEMRIIAMSGAFEGQFLRTAKLLGADATLTKPIEARVLYEMVGEALS
jgi:two-component system, cell cycle sensor histidine kinase and response regulator CckA